MNNNQARPMSSQEKAIQDFMHRCLVMRKEERIIGPILAELGQHYAADRVSVFEVDDAYAHISRVCQWCSEPSASKALSQPDGPQSWLAWFGEQGPLFLSAPSAGSQSAPEAGLMLSSLGVNCLMAAPVMASDRVVGFLCVDHPRQNTGDLLLLSVASAVCYREAASRRREDAKLERSERKMTDRVNQGLANQKKLHEANENLTTLLAQEKQYTAIIGALSNVYFGLFYIGLQGNTFQELFSQDRVHHTLGAKGDAREALKHMTLELVRDAYQPVMLQFTDFDTIDERLGDQPIMVQEYAARAGGWVQCAFIPVERDQNGRNRTVMCTLRQITAEKEVESQGNLIQALAIPYANIYTVNADTREAICYRMGQAINDRYGQQFAIGNYEENIQTYIANDVLEEDRHLFDRVRTVDGVNALLADNKAFYFNYRVDRNGRIAYYQCQLVKPDQSKNEFVIGFKDVNEEKSAELAAQRRVEEALAVAEKANEALRDEMDIAGALSRDYPDVVLLDFTNDTAVTIKCRGHIVPKDQRVVRRSYRDTWDYYIQTYVLEEDRNVLNEAISIERVKRMLAESDEWIFKCQG